ncbi:MAG: transketolase C-terminal domain-containing protein [Bdellovibrionota bacterium]
MKGPAYLRLTRQNVPDLFPSGAKFNPLKLMEIKKASPGILCVATGAAVTEAVQAAEKLTAQGISISVWNASCLKPFDNETLVSIAKGAKLVITVEDHSVIGGLGTCVAEALAQAGSSISLVKLGIQDTFGESGEGFELYEKFGLSALAITKAVIQRVR